MHHTQNHETAATRDVKSVEQTTCCIVGGGPAGVILALLLARKDIPVLLLESHMNFDRDFRGDTVHPSVLSILEEIGLADRLLQEVPHTRMTAMNIQTGKELFKLADFSRLQTKYPFVALIPQEQFLEFVVAECRRYPSFQLIMGAQVDQLVIEQDIVRGVRYRGHDGDHHEVQAVLTVGADGRFSRLRKLANFEPIKTSAPMDVLWFRLSRKASDPAESQGRFAHRAMVVMLYRDDYWQVGYLISKGTYKEVRAQGLEHLRNMVVEAAPELADRVGEINDWQQISVLSVESNRLPRWYRPGLLLIGDAAHVMSPVGGVGINYAIQDAVEAANILSGKLRYGIVQTSDLARVQRRRVWPTIIIQAFQHFLQKRVMAAALKSDLAIVPPGVQMFVRIPLVKNFMARFIGLGVFPTHVREP